MRTIRSAALLAALAQIAQAQPTLYGLSFDGKLITINTATGAGTLVGNTGLSSCDAMSADPSGRLFAVSANDDLYRIDASSACAALIGDVSQVEYVEELAFSPAGILFAAGSANADVGAERLITIDPSTGQSATVGLFGVAHDVDAMAWFPDDGMLYGSDLTLGAWLRISPVTGAAVNLGPQPNFLYALAVSPSGVLYATAHTSGGGSPSTLVTVDRLSGAATVVGAVGFDTVAGLAFASPPAPVPGDANCDGHADILDINAFVAAIIDPAQYALLYPCCPLANADINGDGHVDVIDINPFVALLLGRS
ncbi:hypothetical protein RAS1_15450 [Phycisphaerae bacterium RAS1]|nr:hypothetical protein RAS1_15450 [Phycisphaerae bacterium RAS1]